MRAVCSYAGLPFVDVRISCRQGLPYITGDHCCKRVTSQRWFSIHKFTSHCTYEGNLSIVGFLSTMRAKLKTFMPNIATASMCVVGIVDIVVILFSFSTTRIGTFNLITVKRNGDYILYYYSKHRYQRGKITDSIFVYSLLYVFSSPHNK